MDAVSRAVDEGADLVDIGGVKAGVGAEVTEAAEIDRVVPFVARVRARFPDLPISVDTWRAGVAVAACEAGADLINDTWAGADPALAEVAARFGAGIVCSHTGGAVPRTNPYRVSYPDVVAAVIEQTTTAADRMVALGVPRWAGRAGTTPLRAPPGGRRGTPAGWVPANGWRGPRCGSTCSEPCEPSR